MKSLNDDREANNCNPTHLFVLHQFTQERRILQIGGALLPDLVEFYQWIHTELSHLVTYQKAGQISIGTIITLSARRYSQEYFDYLKELFDKVKCKRDLYVQHVMNYLAIFIQMFLNQAYTPGTWFLKITFVCDIVCMCAFVCVSVFAPETISN